MVCPNCGRTIEYGEICQCQQLEVARRQEELNNENTENNENKRIRYERQTKEKSEKIQEASEKAEEAMDNVVNFGKYIVDCFKDMKNIDKNFINKQDIKSSTILIIVHTILTILLVYLALTKQPITLIFSLMSIFKTHTTAALLLASISITVMCMFSKLGMLFYKAKNSCFYELTSEYIFTIPFTLLAIITTLLNGIIGMIFTIPIICFGTLWTYNALERNGMEKEKAMIAISIVLTFLFSLSVLIIKIIA